MIWFLDVSLFLCLLLLVMFAVYAVQFLRQDARDAREQRQWLSNESSGLRRPSPLDEARARYVAARDRLLEATEHQRRAQPRWRVTFTISNGARHEILLDDTQLSRLAVLSAALRPNGIERVNQ